MKTVIVKDTFVLFCINSFVLVYTFVFFERYPIVYTDLVDIFVFSTSAYKYCQMLNVNPRGYATTLCTTQLLCDGAIHSHVSVGSHRQRQIAGNVYR